MSPTAPATPETRVTAGALVRRWMARHPGLLGGAAGAVVVNRVLSIALPLSLGLFFEVAAAGHGGAKERLARLLPVHPETTGAFFAVFGLLTAALAGSVFLERFATGLAGLKFSQYLQNRLFEAHVRQVASGSPADSADSRLLFYASEAKAVQSFLAKAVLGVAGDAAVLAAAFALLVVLQLSWAMVTAAGFALAAVMALGLGRWGSAALVRHRAARGRLLRFVQARLRAGLTIKVTNRERRELKRAQQLANQRLAAGARQIAWSSLTAALPPLFFYGTTGVVLALALREAEGAARGVSGGELVTFILILFYLRGVMRRLLEVPAHWHPGRLSLERMARVFMRAAERPSTRQAREAEKAVMPRPRVALHGLVVAGMEQPLGPGTAAEKPAWHRQFDQGTTTLIRGRAGKPLFRVLLQLEPAVSGRITLGDDDLDRLAPWQARQRLALVSSAAPLLGDTVLEAVTYHRSERRRREAAQLLRDLGFPVGPGTGGLDRPLDTVDNRLSLSECGVLRVARALLSRKRILLLENPFSELDPEHGERVAACLNALRPTHCLLLAAEQAPPELAIDAIWDPSHDSTKAAARTDQKGQDRAPQRPHPDTGTTPAPETVGAGSPEVVRDGGSRALTCLAREARCLRPVGLLRADGVHEHRGKRPTPGWLNVSSQG